MGLLPRRRRYGIHRCGTGRFVRASGFLPQLPACSVLFGFAGLLAAAGKEQVVAIVVREVGAEERYQVVGVAGYDDRGVTGGALAACGWLMPGEASGGQRSIAEYGTFITTGCAMRRSLAGACPAAAAALLLASLM